MNSFGTTAGGTYNEVNLSLVPMVGWNLIVVGFSVSGGVSTAVGWIRRPDGTYQNGNTRAFTVLYTDSSSFLMTSGGSLSYSAGTFSVKYGLKGVVSNIRFYNYLVTTANVDDSYLTTCNAYCVICKSEDGSKCIEQYSS